MRAQEIYPAERPSFLNHQASETAENFYVAANPRLKLFERAEGLFHHRPAFS
jgi:hypothetical protein